jgi:hypothetical protein
MRIPKKIKVGGNFYEIRFVDSEEIEECGELNRSRNLIRIAKGMPQSQTEETILHELLHACNAGLKEEVIDGLAVVLYQSLKESNLLK